MNGILDNISEHLPLWNALDNETKLLNYVELCLYLVRPEKWSVRVSGSILSDKDKLEKIQVIASELNEGKNIWHRLSHGTIKNYTDLPKTIKTREELISEKDDDGKEFFRANKVYGKDLLQLLFNIHHIRIDDAKSDKKISVLGIEVHFAQQKQNELLFAMFDDRYLTVYFLDILKHDDLYKYSKILNIVDNEDFPRPFQNINLAPVLRNGFSDDEFRKLLFNGVMMPFEVGKYSAMALQSMTTSGFTDKVVSIYNRIRLNEFDMVLPSDFIYRGQMFSEFYGISFKPK